MSKKKQRNVQPISARPQISEREQGRRAFARGDLDSAIAHWTKALQARSSARLEQALAEAHFRRACLNRKRPSAAILDDLQTASTLVPGDPRYSFHTGLLQHQLGNLQEAIKAYRESLRHESSGYDRPAYHLCLALAESGQDVYGDPAWKLLTAEQQNRLLPPNRFLINAVEALERNDYPAAETALQRTVDFDAGFSHYYLGVLAWRRGERDKALDHWLAAQKAGFMSRALRHNLAVAYTVQAVGQADSPDLESTLRAALKLESASPLLQALQQRAEFLAGNRAAEAGNWQAALAHWQKVRQQYVRQETRVPRELAANMANAYEHLQRWTEAAETWRELLRRRPRRGENAWPVQYVVQLWRHIDTLYARAGHFDKSAETLRYAIRAQSDDLTLNLALVKRYMENQNWRSAKTAVLRVLEAAPRHPDAMALYAQIVDADGDLDQMIEAWEWVLPTHHKHQAEQRLLKLYVERGQFYQSIEDDEAAAADFEKALRLAPADARLRATYGALLVRSARERACQEFERVDLAVSEAALTIIKAWYQLGDREEAARWLQRANSAKGLRPTLYVELGAAIFESHKGPAIKYFEQALSQAAAADLPDLLTCIAVVYESHRRIPEAYDYARRALQQDAGFGPAHVHLGLWDIRRGRRSAALNHFQSALRWAQQKQRPDIVVGIEEAIGLLEEGHTPTLDDILDTIDPEQTDGAMRRLMGRLDNQVTP